MALSLVEAQRTSHSCSSLCLFGPLLAHVEGDYQRLWWRLRHTIVHQKPNGLKQLWMHRWFLNLSTSNQLLNLKKKIDLSRLLVPKRLWLEKSEECMQRIWVCLTWILRIFLDHTRLVFKIDWGLCLAGVWISLLRREFGKMQG